MNARMNSEAAQLQRTISRLDWNFSEAETDYLTHNIHRYSGKFIPQIAAQAISLLTKPGQTVLDPYCGSGTTVIEAGLQGRRAIGIDLNPLAVLIARSKISPIKSKQADALFERFVALAETATPQGDLFSKRRADRATISPKLNDPWFKKWFNHDALVALIRIESEIASIDDRKLRDLSTVAFSDILRRVSNAHQGYPNVMFDRKAQVRRPPFPLFLKALKNVLQTAVSLQERDVDWTKCIVKEGDARSLQLKSESVDAVVTHPPYIGSIPYAEYGALSLKWLGKDPKELDKELTGGRRQTRDVLARFVEGYAGMFRESARVLKPGKFIFVMVGNPVVHGELVDLSKITIDAAENVGCVLIASTHRSGSNRRANKMGDENLLFFQRH